jgi:hypothetical protein
MAMEKKAPPGSARSPTNLDLASAGRGERVLCLVPTGSLAARPSNAPRLPYRTSVKIVSRRDCERQRPGPPAAAHEE